MKKETLEKAKTIGERIEQLESFISSMENPSRYYFDFEIRYPGTYAGSDAPSVGGGKVRIPHNLIKQKHYYAFLDAIQSAAEDELFELKREFESL